MQQSHFFPYVEGVNVYFNSHPVYSADYYDLACQPASLSCDKITFSEQTFDYPSLPFNGSPHYGDVKINVLLSEPLSAPISGALWPPFQGQQAIDEISALDGSGKLWQVTFKDIFLVNQGEYKFEFYGTDLAGNQLLNFDLWGGSGLVETIPHRTGANDWSPANPQAAAGKSRIFKFNFQGACPNKLTDDSPANSFSQLNGDCDCEPVADFTFLPKSDGLTIDFDASSSSGTEPLTYTWAFGGDGDGAGIMPEHAFSEGGTFLVTLTVTDECGNTATAEKIVTVNEGSPTSLWLTLSGPTLATECQQVSFNANVTGGVPPYTYTWNMGSSYCSPNCPTDCSSDPEFAGDANVTATFLSTGLFTNPVCVEVKDAVGNSEYQCLDIKVKNGIQPLEIVFNGTPACGNEYASNTLIAMWPDIDPLSAFEYPTDYLWDFGDGDTFLDNFDGGGVALHAYSPGDYLVTLTVSDPNGSMQATRAISICGPGGNNPPDCELVNSINPFNPTIVLDYVDNSSAPSSVYFDYTSNQPPLCTPTYKWTARMDDCGLGYLFNDEDMLLGLQIGSGLNVDLTAENWWGTVTQFRKPWGCLRLQCVESGPFCETCVAPNPSNPCMAYILPDEPKVSQINVEAACPNYVLTAVVVNGGWKLVGSEYTYKEYKWAAYDIDDPSQEIDILVGTDLKAPTINTSHPYFERFSTSRYPQFIVKLKVTDFANQIGEAGDVVSFNPFRLNVKNTYSRCPETWSYFENTPLVQGGTGNYEFTWTTASGDLDFQSNDLHDPFPYFRTPATGSKTYNLLVKMLDGNGAEVCQLTKSIEVEAASLSLSMPSTAGACYSAGTAIIGPSSLGIQGGSGNFGYEWTTPNSSDLIYLTDIFAANPIVKDFPNGQITYTLRVQDLTSECMTTGEVIVTGYPNDISVSLPGPTTVCYGEEVTITGIINPFNQIYHEWTTNHPKPELVQSGGNGSKKQLTFSEIMSSYPGTYNVNLKATDIVSGCTAEATTSLTVRSPWRYKGDVSKIASAIKNSSMPLWEPGSNNYFTSNPPNLNNIEVSWHPDPPENVTYYGNTALPTNGSFTPTKEVPFLTMTVYDNVSGCSKTVRTMRYIISEHEPRLSIFAENGASCIGDPVCFDLVFDAQLSNYSTPLLPDNVTAMVAINAPINSPQQPNFKYIPVKLLLENSSGLYKAKVCETDFFQFETHDGPHYTASLSMLNGIWSNVESASVEVAINEMTSSNDGHVIKCVPPLNINGAHERGLSYSFGLQCTGSAVHNTRAYTFARDYIELFPDYDLELIPGALAGSYNRGAYLGIDPCIIPQAVGDNPNSLQSGVSSEERNTRTDSSQAQPLLLEVFPNPFGDEVNIEFHIPIDCAGRTSIVLYDITGMERGIVFLQEDCLSGVHQTRFKTDHIPSGIYFCELKTCNNLRISRKLVKIINH